MYPNLTVIFLMGIFHGPRHSVAAAVCADLSQCWSVLPSFPIKLPKCKMLLLVALMVSFTPKCTILCSAQRILCLYYSSLMQISCMTEWVWWHYCAFVEKDLINCSLPLENFSWRRVECSFQGITYIGPLNSSSKEKSRPNQPGTAPYPVLGPGFFFFYSLSLSFPRLRADLLV